MKDLFKLTAAEAAALLERKEISSVELTTSCLERIRVRNSDVGAWRHIDEEYALQQARDADRTPAKSRLHGIPFGVKDVIDTADLPTEYGAKARAGHRPSADAACVKRMKDAGAVLLGKLVTTEYALYTPNETRHPFNLAHTAGGSSSGTGAAVADLHVPIAFGNQTAGSLIRPAAFCGVFGLKPTHGAGPVDGILPLQPFFDTLGYMARGVEDLQAFFGIVSKGEPALGQPVQKRLKIGLCRTQQWDRALPESRFVLEEVARQLSGRGFEVAEFSLPDDHADLVESHRVVLWKGVAESLDADFSKSRDKLSAALIGHLEAAREISPETYRKHRAFAERCRSGVNDLFGDFDAIICPSAPGEAPVGMATGDPVFQIVWTLLGVPVINLPVGSGPKGLPLGVQLIGRRSDDTRLLAMARHLMDRITRIQMATPWASAA